MNKKTAELELRKLLSILTTGNREEVRNAKKTIEMLWHKENKAFISRDEVRFTLYNNYK